MEEKIQLSKANIVGEFFYHIFEDDFGNKIIEETTEQDYRQLATPQHKNPVKKGYKWFGSFSDFKYDTPTGKLTEGFYADNGDKYRVVINGIEELCLDKKEIADNKISASKVASMVAEVNNLEIK